MVLVNPTNLSVLDFKGLHLYHSHVSNCAGRVRLLLEEKGLPWISHHIHLAKSENVTEEYFGINPKGVVPTLVHDGKVITESNDILIYLEEAYTDTNFRAVTSKKQSDITRWLELSTSSHMPGIKTFQYYRINATALKKTDEKIALYRRLQKDPEYLEFHGKHDLPGKNFTSADSDKANNLLEKIFFKMERILEKSQWLVGDTYTLADISWSPSVKTLMRGSQGKFDFTPYPHLMDWYNRISTRPAFQIAITEWYEKTWE